MRFKVNPLDGQLIPDNDEGTNVSITQSGGSTSGVSSISKQGDAQLTGDVTLSAGANVTLTQTGNNIAIASSGGGGSGGTVDTIVEGTGIDVDATDPANPIVSIDSATQASLALADSATQPGDNVSTLTNDAGYLTSAPVSSVNGQTGVVSLDTDDIADTASNRYTNDTDIARLANTSGTNTGDQASIVGITGTTAEFNTANTDADFYTTNGTDVSLADGGTGASLVDPNADRIFFWDDSAGSTAFLTPSTGLTLSGTNLTVRTASTTQTGIAETATDAEFTTGTDTTRYVTPNQVANITQTMANKTLTSPVINTPTGIVKGDVGLGNVDNTSDATKNSATATLTNKTISGANNTLSNIASTSLVEGFVRGRLQADTTNSAPTGLTIQHGWGYIVGNGTARLSKTVTFPVAFSSAPIVIVSFISAAATAAGTPTSTASFTTDWSSFRGAASDDITTSNFLMRLEATANHSASFNFGFTWIAIGPV